ncbi:hypothetical protein [Cryobacterium sp. BB736]|uniref:hypothetical protein n=1 Tax=Cryobacterium sp. BB736 TaxID=2746963 RepID=UPI001876C2AF|nr:hypothetical protein [Cryobacterium sp. BB736]
MAGTREAPEVERLPLAPRVLVLLLAAGALFFALWTATIGTLEIVKQLTSHTVYMTMHPAPIEEGGVGGFVSFSESGERNDAIIGQWTATMVTVPDLSAGTMVVKMAADVLGVLTLVVLALGAFGLGRALLAGKPFTRATSRNAVFAALAILALGIAAQFVEWWARLLVLHERSSLAFSRDLVADPTVITVGFAIALVAIAFRYGERLQRDTEGLV